MCEENMWVTTSQLLRFDLRLNGVLWLFLHRLLQWGGRSSRHKYEHMVDDLLLNVHEQWVAGHDLHEDTLDVYFLEVSHVRSCVFVPFFDGFGFDRRSTAIPSYIVIVLVLMRCCLYAQPLLPPSLPRMQCLRLSAASAAVP